MYARDVRGDWCQHCSRFCFLFLALDGVGLVCRAPWTSLLKPTKGADFGSQLILISVARAGRTRRILSKVFRHLMGVSCSSWGSASSTFLGADAEGEKRIWLFPRAGAAVCGKKFSECL
jgi:hypothetical protein